MSRSEFSSPAAHPARWQVLGELHLAAGPDAGTAARAWLVEILSALDLPPDLLDKIVRAAQNALLDLPRLATGEPELRAVSLRVLLTPNLPAEQSAGRNWGFFHLAKTEASAAKPSEAVQLVEIYLYLDSHT